MLHKGMTKAEIDNELIGKGDFVRIDNLTRFLKDDLPIDIRKEVVLILADIYEKKSMFNEAAKMHDNFSIYSSSFSEKIKHYTKEAELYIKAGLFERADEAVKNAMTQANARERNEISLAIKDFYKRQAGVYEKELRRANAVRIYEKLLETNITPAEREEIKKKLLDLYDKLGRVKEFLVLKRSLGGWKNLLAIARIDKEIKVVEENIFISYLNFPTEKSVGDDFGVINICGARNFTQRNSPRKYRRVFKLFFCII